MNNTLLSKDAPVELTIQKMQEALQNLGASYTLKDLKNPLNRCYSINIASIEAPKHIYANGKGNSIEATKASALGEYIERLQTNMFFADFYLPKLNYFLDQKEFDFRGGYLNKELLKIYDPYNELLKEDLIDFNSDYFDKIVSLPYKEQKTDETIYFPINILNSLYVSNGLSSGNTPQEAQVQALSEICERYVKIEILKNSYSLPLYPKSILKQYSKLLSNINTLEESGYIIKVLDASFEGRFPVVAIALINPKNSTLFVSFGSHPILEVALDRTINELMQGRDLNMLDSFETPTFDKNMVTNYLNIESHYIDSNGVFGFDFLSSKHSFNFSSWRYNGKNSLDELHYLSNLLYNFDKKIYLREYNYLGIYSCSIIVPNFSEVYPIEDLIYNNKNRAKEIRDMIINYQNYNFDEILENITPLENSIDLDSYIGVIFKNPFTILEFKAHLYLSIKEYEAAKELLIYSLQKTSKIVYELLLLKEQNKDFSLYQNTMFEIFTKEDVLNACDIIDGKKTLIDTTYHQDYLNILELYKKLNIKKSSL